MSAFASIACKRIDLAEYKLATAKGFIDNKIPLCGKGRKYDREEDGVNTHARTSAVITLAAYVRGDLDQTATGTEERLETFLTFFGADKFQTMSVRAARNHAVRAMGSRGEYGTPITPPGCSAPIDPGKMFLYMKKIYGELKVGGQDPLYFRHMARLAAASVAGREIREERYIRDHFSEHVGPITGGGTYIAFNKAMESVVFEVPGPVTAPTESTFIDYFDDNIALPSELNSKGVIVNPSLSGGEPTIGYHGELLKVSGKLDGKYPFSKKWAPAGMIGATDMEFALQCRNTRIEQLKSNEIAFGFQTTQVKKAEWKLNQKEHGFSWFLETIIKKSLPKVSPYGSTELKLLKEPDGFHKATTEMLVSYVYVPGTVKVKRYTTAGILAAARTLGDTVRKHYSAAEMDKWIDSRKKEPETRSEEEKKLVTLMNEITGLAFTVPQLKAPMRLCPFTCMFYMEDIVDYVSKGVFEDFAPTKVNKHDNTGVDIDFEKISKKEIENSRLEVKTLQSFVDVCLEEFGGKVKSTMSQHLPSDDLAKLKKLLEDLEMEVVGGNDAPGAGAAGAEPPSAPGPTGTTRFKNPFEYIKALNLMITEGEFPDIFKARPDFIHLSSKMKFTGDQVNWGPTTMNHKAARNILANVLPKLPSPQTAEIKGLKTLLPELADLWNTKGTIALFYQKFGAHKIFEKVG